jgi:hypothetical protein
VVPLVAGSTSLGFCAGVRRTGDEPEALWGLGPVHLLKGPSLLMAHVHESGIGWLTGAIREQQRARVTATRVLCAGGHVYWQSTLAPLHLSGLLYHEDVWRLNRVLLLYFDALQHACGYGRFRLGYPWSRRHASSYGSAGCWGVHRVLVAAGGCGRTFIVHAPSSRIEERRLGPCKQWLGAVHA